jgi:hypothetical protein
MRASIGALPSWRQGLEPWDTWQRVDACPTLCLRLEAGMRGIRLHGPDREDLNSLQCRELTVIKEALQIEQAIFLVFRASSHF